jgi:geranylgeranyl diphosphate synthase, type I
VTAPVRERPAREVTSAWLRQRVDAELAGLLARRLAELRFLGADIAPFDQVLGRLISGPGKRLRPAFVFWGFRAAGGPAEGPDAEAAVRVGCAIEILHAAALILDDLMDGSPVRRGEPAAHVRLARQRESAGWRGDPGEFGRSAALLLGLQAFTWADAAINEAGVAPGRLPGVWRIFTGLRTEMIGGQYLDLLNAGRGGSDPAAAQQTTVYKSGKYTVQRPLQLGAAVAGLEAAGPGSAGGFLSGYSLPLGEAFQLRDDVLGVFGDPAVTGKPADEDLRAGKQTLLLVLARQLAGPRGRAALDAVAGNEHATAAQLADARKVLASCGALAAVEQRIARLAQQAQDAVTADGEIPPETRRALLALAGQAAGIAG